MLEAIRRTSLNDDVFGEDATTSGFEAEMADLCGHEAAAFVLSGTMANQLALRALLHQPPHAIMADASSHIIHFEAGGTAYLSGAMVQAVRPQNGLYLTVEDARRHAILTDDVHKCPTRVLSIENTAAGVVVPLEELRHLKSWAGANGVAMHVDGARLWDAVAACGDSIRDFAQCADVLTLDFSKNLGAPMGSMVIGPRELIRRLKRIRKSIGGGMRQAGVLAAAARQAVYENFGTRQTDSRGVLMESHRLARRAAGAWARLGGRLLRPVETNMIWLDLRGLGIAREKWVEAGSRRGVKVDGKRVVFHHQICGEAMRRLESAMEDILGDKREAKLHRQAELARL
jgi:threonine aldolase